MIRKSSIILFLSLLVFSFSDAQTRFSFSDFDYPEESVLYGSRNKVSFFIPVNEYSLVGESELSLNFGASEVLDKKNSFTTVAVAGIPMRTVSPSLDNSLINIKIPLEARYVSSGFFRIDVMTDLKISEEICEIYSEGAFWIRMLPSSYIDLNTDDGKKQVRSPRHISDFIPMANKLLLPKNPDLTTLSYAAYIKSYFKKVLLQEFKVGSIADTTGNGPDRAIVLALIKDLPPSLNAGVSASLKKGQGILALTGKNKQAGDTLVPHTTLVVTAGDVAGFEKAAQAVLDKDIFSSAFTDTMTIDQGMDLRQDVSNRETAAVSLNQLGVDEGLIEGIGKMYREISIPRSIFGASLNKMEFLLDFKYRPIKTTEDAYVNIFLDGVLKESHELDESGVFNKVVNFDHFDLKKNNILKIEFYYVPEGGMCVSNPATFYAQLDLGSSSIKPVSYNDKPQLNFFYFPENFNEAPMRIYWNAKTDVTDVDALSKLVSLVNPVHIKKTAFNFPRVVSIDSLNTPHDKDYNKIIISDDLAPFTKLLNEHAYLQVQEDGYSYNKGDYNKYFNIKYANAIGFNQLFTAQDNAVMFIYDPGHDEKILYNLIDEVDGQYLSNTGNLVLSSPENAYFFSLKKDDADVDQVELETGFDAVWNKYRIFIVFGLFVLMVVLLIYVFQKSQESKKNITDEN